MLGVALALVSALLFGAMTVALAFSFRRYGDAYVAAFVTTLVGFLTCATIAALGGEWGGTLWPFVLAGLLAPGGSQLLFILAVRDAGPARAAVIAGGAPLVAVTLSVLILGEQLRTPLVIGALLIVAGALALAAERARPESFRAIGLVYAILCTLFYATRDNVVRGLADGTDVAPQLAGATTILSGSALLLAFLVATRRRRLIADIRAAAPAFALPGVLWGASYAPLFEAFYRSPVSVVSPLVATECLFSVTFAVVLLRRSELVGRPLVVGALLVVAGGVLIGAFR